MNLSQKTDTLVFVPAGVAHQDWNAGSAPEADLEVVTPATSRDLVSMMGEAKPSKVENAAQYIRVLPPLGELKSGVGHQGLNERVLAERFNTATRNRTSDYGFMSLRYA